MFPRMLGSDDGVRLDVFRLVQRPLESDHPVDDMIVYKQLVL